jgi:hypothetical protein
MRCDLEIGILEETSPEFDGVVLTWEGEGYLETSINRVMSYTPPSHPEIGINGVRGVMCQVRKP